VDNARDAELIIVRTSTQAERSGGGFGGGNANQPSEVNIDFPKEKWDAIKKLAATKVPVVVYSTLQDRAAYCLLI
jgi:hypothetical protein